MSDASRPPMPQDEKYLRRLGREALAREDFAEAARVARRAVERGGASPWTLLLLARAEEKQGRIAPALEAARAASRAAPHLLDARAAQGRLLLRLGRQAEGARLLVELADDPTLKPGVLADALTALAARRMRSEITDVVAGLLGDPVLDEALNRLASRYRDRVLAVIGEYYLHRGQWRVAADVLQEVSTPGELPVRTMRTCTKRARQAGSLIDADRLATMTLAAVPSDDSIVRLKEYVSQGRALFEGGFPWPARRFDAAYAPDPRRIFYLLHNSLPRHSAGYATRTHGLLTGLKGRGWDVAGVTRLGYPHDLSTADKAEEVPPFETVDNIRYHRLISEGEHQRTRYLEDYVHRYADRLTSLARQERPSLIHAASNHWNGITASVVAGRLGVPSIYEVRGLWEVTRASRDKGFSTSDVYRLSMRMEAEAAAAADRALVITGALRDEMVRRGVNAEHITVLPNGVDTSRFVPRERDATLTEKWGLVGKTVLGYVGSILDYEGLGLLLEAAATLRRERNDFKVLIVGDGVLRQKLTRKADEAGLHDIVVFTGKVPHNEVDRYYSLIDIAPFPRLPLPVCEMVSPLKPFEAMAMQKCVVVSDVQALKEIVQHERTGMHFTKGDATSLANVLRGLLDAPERRQRMADAGREWVCAERDWASLTGRLDSLYGELLSSWR